MPRLNDDSASNIEKGTQSKWDFKVETFVDWQNILQLYIYLGDCYMIMLEYLRTTV